MLLKALYDFAHSRKLLDDLAFAPKAIRWVIQLDAEGNLLGVMDTSEDGKRGRVYDGVPKLSGSKNSGGVAEFLTDGLIAVFGLEPEPENLSTDEKKRQARLKNNELKYQNFWQQVQEAQTDSKAQSLSALLSFHAEAGTNPSFLRWGNKEDAKANEKPTWWMMTAKGEEVRYNKADAFTFSVSGNLIFEQDILRDWWRNLCEHTSAQKEEKAERGVCLITGQENVPIARTHDRKIEVGYSDTPPGGAAIVSFEKSSPSFSSYGYAQSYNAPTSINAAKAYCEGLNHLIKNRKHHIRIANTTVCFWARDSEEATDVIADLFDKPKPEVVRDFFDSVRAGIKKTVTDSDEFYSVTLSGNSGRVVVRNWLQMPLKNAVVNLSNWFADLDIASYGPPKSDERVPPLKLKELALTTVREEKHLRADILAQLYRAALDGKAPPLSLLNLMLKRLDIDLVKNGPNTALRNLSRFALLRLIVNRNRKGDEPMIEPQVFETNDAAYNCGRLMAVLSEAQQKAHDYKLEGAGVAERYFGTASSSPASVFPLLIRLNRHHLNKISKSERYKGHERFLEESIQKILSLFRPEDDHQPPRFPRALNLPAQGRFALGFYQQKAADDAARREHYANRNNQTNQDNQ